MDDVHVTPGGAEQYWDVSFADGIMDATESREAGLDELAGILVHVCPDTGEVSLSAGYEPRSAPGRDERTLFHRHKAEIEAAILAKVADDADPAYAAFAERHGGAPRP